MPRAADFFWATLSWRFIVGGLALVIVTMLASLVVVGWLLVRIPATFFLDSHDRNLWIDQHPVIRWTGKLAKNFVGICLILAGLGLVLPGVPGPGVLTLLVGLMLFDFPGKRRLERRIVGRPAMLHTVNRLRGRFGRPPLVLE